MLGPANVFVEGCSPGEQIPSPQVRITDTRNIRWNSEVAVKCVVFFSAAVILSRSTSESFTPGSDPSLSSNTVTCTLATSLSSWLPVSCSTDAHCGASHDESGVRPYPTKHEVVTIVWCNVWCICLTPQDASIGNYLYYIQNLNSTNVYKVFRVVECLCNNISDSLIRVLVYGGINHNQKPDCSATGIAQAIAHTTGIDTLTLFAANSMSINFISFLQDQVQLFARASRVSESPVMSPHPA